MKSVIITVLVIIAVQVTTFHDWQPGEIFDAPTRYATVLLTFLAYMIFVAIKDGRSSERTRNGNNGN